MPRVDQGPQPATAPALSRRIFHWIGLDRAIAYTVLGRFWQAFAGLITLALITRYLTPNEQGYYYTFYSLVALQIVFELGFSFVILQLAAHERAQLTFSAGGGIAGDAVSRARLASILHKAVYWYLAAGLVMTVALVPAGFAFFNAHQVPGAQVAWRLPWCCLVLFNMLAFQIDPVFSFLEGCGFVAQVARRRFWQALLGSALAWMAMIVHHGLYAPAMLILGQVTVSLGYLLFSDHRRLLAGLMRHRVGGHTVGWRTEIWPFQWKIALSWICGYFIYQIFSPVLFAFQGPVAAGRMGMSLNLATGIGSIAMAWMNTKASPFGQLVARREYQALDRLFFRTLWQSTLLLVFGALLFLFLLWLYGNHVPKFSTRLLPEWAIALLLLQTIMNHIVYSEALYLRCHKEEPFVGVSAASAVLVAGLTYVLGRYWGADAVVVGLVLQGLIFSLPSGTYLFLTRRRAWHRQSESNGPAI
jgi:O-antigen/teichoic acid export membrane protein